MLSSVDHSFAPAAAICRRRFRAASQVLVMLAVAIGSGCAAPGPDPITWDGARAGSVVIDIESGLALAVTDESGLFSIVVPAAKGETLLLTALKNGITGYREFITVPDRGSIEVRFKTGL